MSNSTCMYCTRMFDFEYNIYRTDSTQQLVRNPPKAIADEE